jgi:Crp-like helix-turn-helix domain
LQQCYRLLLRSSSFLNLDLHERIAITLLELASDFEIKESRGTLLKSSFSHQHIADLVGASRPRVTEHLGQLEREHLIIRQGRQFIVRIDKIGGIEHTAIRHDDDASAPGLSVSTKLFCVLQNISSAPPNTFISSKRLLSLTWVSPTIEPVPRKGERSWGTRRPGCRQDRSAGAGNR